MGDKINSQEEYERRKKLLEKQNKDHEKGLRRTITKPIRGLIDPLGFADEVIDIVDNCED